MRNNANSERLRLESASVTGVAEPSTEITEASFNNLNQLVSRGGGGETLVSGTTDEPATVTVGGTDAVLSDVEQWMWVKVESGIQAFRAIGTQRNLPEDERVMFCNVIYLKD